MKPIEKVVEELTSVWFGKKDVVDIFHEEKNGQPYVVFTVDRHPINRLDYPLRASGYAIIVRPPRNPQRWDEWVRVDR